MEQIVDFSGENLRGEKIFLSSYKGKKLLLAFFRDTTCPFCNMRLRELIVNYPSLKQQNIEVLALFPSTKERINEYSGGQNPPFELIADPEELIYSKIAVKRNKFGILKTMLKFKKMLKVMRSGFMNTKSLTQAPILPLDILIDENQYILIRYDGKDFSDHLPLNEILK